MHLRLNYTHRLKVNGWEKIFHISGKGKKAGVAVLISDKIDFKTNATVRDKERQCIMIKGTIQQDDITLVNLYAPNIGAPKYVKQFSVDINGETDRIIDIVGDLNIPLTSMDRSSRQKINKETVALYDTVN